MPLPFALVSQVLRPRLPRIAVLSSEIARPRAHGTEYLQRGANVLGISTLARCIGLVVYKTLGSPGIGRLWSEKHRPPDLDQVVARKRKRFKRTDTRKIIRESLPPDACCVQPGIGFIRRRSQITGRSIGDVKTRSSAETQTLWGVPECSKGPDAALS